MSVLALAVLSLASTARTASAQPDRAAVTITDCDGAHAGAESLQGLLALEGITGAALASGTLVSIAGPCGGALEMRVTIKRGEIQSTHTIELRSVAPRVRDRVLALFVGELLEGVERAAAQADAPDADVRIEASEAVATRASALPRDAAAITDPSAHEHEPTRARTTELEPIALPSDWSFRAALTGRAVVSDHPAFALGGRVSAAWRSIDVELAFEAIPFSEAAATGALLVPMLSAGFSPLRWTSGGLGASFGLRAHGGLVIGLADPILQGYSASSSVSATFGFSLRSAFELAIADGLAFELALDLGMAWGPKIAALFDTIASLSGPFALAGVGLRFQ